MLELVCVGDRSCGRKRGGDGGDSSFMSRELGATGRYIMIKIFIEKNVNYV